MGFLTHIENLKTKPEHVRRRAAFWYSFSITAVIFVFWISSFTSFGLESKSAVARAVDSAGTPAQSLMAAAGTFFENVKGIFFTPRKIEYSTVEVSAGGR